ncbi:hypothetical protein B9Z55_003352 [Caenorhabditis nigoni]|nr:hypothetical protein B9Z55_003352 [Caenorhabditis nigoni]
MLDMVLNITDVSICGAHLFVFGHHFTSSPKMPDMAIKINEKHMMLVMTFDYDLAVPAYEASDIYQLSTYVYASEITFDVNFRIPGMFFEASKPYLHYFYSFGAAANDSESDTREYIYGMVVPSNESIISMNVGGIRSFHFLSVRISWYNSEAHESIVMEKTLTGNEYYFEEHLYQGRWDYDLKYTTSPGSSDSEPVTDDKSQYQEMTIRVYDKK